jgi:hypothetical protein
MTTIRITSAIGVVFIDVNFAANTFVGKTLLCSHAQVIQDVLPCSVLSNNIEN